MVSIKKENEKEKGCMMKSLILIFALVSLTAKAQVPMTTDNRSLGPGTYEESMAQIQGASPPSDGYRKGWQSSKSSMSGGSGLPKIGRAHV